MTLRVVTLKRAGELLGGDKALPVPFPLSSFDNISLTLSLRRDIIRNGRY